MSDLKHFAPLLDDKDILHQRDDMAPHLMDWRGQFDGAAQGVIQSKAAASRHSWNF